MFSVISTLPILISILYSSYGYGSVKRAKDKKSGWSSHFLILFVRSFARENPLSKCYYITRI